MNVFPTKSLRSTLLSAVATGMLLCACNANGNRDDKAGTAPVDTVPVMVMQIQKCSRLYSAECHLHKIVTHSDTKALKGSVFSHDFNIPLPGGSRKVAIPMEATVKAYIDFSNFSERNVRRNGRKIEIILPDPQLTLTSTKVNHEEAKAYVATLRSNFTDEELTSFERQGRQAIIDDIPQSDILEQARLSATRTLVPMITQMGFSEQDITITFRKRQFSDDEVKQMIGK